MTKEQAIAKLVPVFRQYGYEGATVSRLAQATGLGKASLYHYFPKGKEEMAAAVLECAEAWLTKTVLAPLKEDQDPVAKIQAMGKNLDQFYRSGLEACFLALMSAGEANKLFHQPIQQALTTWITALAQVVEEAGVESELARQRAEDAVIQIQGALILVRVLNDTKPFERVIGRLPEILLQ